MTALAHAQRLPPLDDPWRRLPLLVVIAIIAWGVLLFSFSHILMLTTPPEPELKPIEARIMEIPPTAGLGAPAEAPKAGPAIARPVSPPKPKEIHHAKPKTLAPAVPVSPEGTLKHDENAAPATGSGNPGSANAPTSGGETGGSEGSSGIAGSDASGAHAIYAPVPKIPDELRENVFNAVAVAHFKVSYDGTVDVTLSTPTPDPRINQILLDTLKGWKFFPAMKEGVAVNSEFDVRIPVSVQ